MLGDTRDRFERDIVGDEIFDRDRRRDIVVRLRLRARGKADRIELDVADLAVGRHIGREDLELDIACLG